MKNNLTPFFLILFFTSITCLTSSADVANRNSQSVRYIDNQSFDGQSFFKDNNIWVYNEKFADSFGMPSVGVDQKLKGVEAAAFRIEDANYKLCGIAGKAENCKKTFRCTLDVYIDEQKFHLPWLNEQLSDYEARYTSLRWLKTQSEFPLKGNPPQGMQRSIANVSALGIWGDRDSKWEAFFVSDEGLPSKGSVSGAKVVAGFKRNAINGLTLISFDQGCSRSKEKSTVNYYLDSRRDLTNQGLIKRYFEFELPWSFITQVDDLLNYKSSEESAFYKRIFESQVKN